MPKRISKHDVARAQAAATMKQFNKAMMEAMQGMQLNRPKLPKTVSERSREAGLRQEKSRGS